MELPDLSHLTAEEQKQILSVIKRQKDEEEKEKAMTRCILYNSLKNFRLHHNQKFTHIAMFFIFLSSFL